VKISCHLVHQSTMRLPFSTLLMKLRLSNLARSFFESMLIPNVTLLNAFVHALTGQRNGNCSWSIFVFTYAFRHVLWYWCIQCVFLNESDSRCESQHKLHFLDVEPGFSLRLRSVDLIFGKSVVLIPLGNGIFICILLSPGP